MYGTLYKYTLFITIMIAVCHPVYDCDRLIVILHHSLNIPDCDPVYDRGRGCRDVDLGLTAEEKRPAG